ncbi:DnaJ-domain-containing protein [Pleurostoma richardsiae]|uniref:DnaJ-domain-containing protein n=1 Tax=Pleurostoma richardsiae TaxID=41990 RepID=A0AA38RFY8_9PEZI|nr:DnaJ-domain-containing protein [Pleurostoma richardsiae]
MGAQQSSAADAETDYKTRKTCYYEVLGIDRLAGDDDIRKAYKRRALELHPDRNIHDVENATRKFAEVQTAYEILSDPQERAWYDSHREAILRGDADRHDDIPSEHYNVHLTATEDIYALMGRFNSSVPFTDGPAGFFGMLDAFFSQLAAEEVAACEWEGQSAVAYPPFGSAGDAYDTVAKAFYNFWSGFSTRKSFSWRDKYHLSDAPDRRVRRLMEKENKKLREDAIRDFNDAIRSLVAFVKKRDPRYVPNTQSETERQEILRNSAAAQAARSRAANREKLAGGIVPDWAKSRDKDDQSDEFATSTDESEIEYIECVVCNKTFKSDKQFEAHEKSKKHAKTVQQLRRQMKQENMDYELHGDVSVLQPRLPRHHYDAPWDPSADIAKGQSHPDNGLSVVLLNDTDKKGDILRTSAEQLGDGDSGGDSGGDGDGDDDGDYAPRDVVENRLVSSRRSEASSLSNQEHNDVENLTSSVAGMIFSDVAGPPKVGKAKAKRERKAASQVELKTAHECGVCQEAFESRTKLFNHIRARGHAQQQSTSHIRKGKKPKK